MKLRPRIDNKIDRLERWKEELKSSIEIESNYHTYKSMIVELRSIETELKNLYIYKKSINETE